MIIANRTPLKLLCLNVHSRLWRLLSRHSNSDRTSWQNCEELTKKLSELEQEAQILELIPDIFESHHSPDFALSAEQSSEIFGEDKITLNKDDFEKKLHFLLTVSQKYKLGEDELNLLERLIHFLFTTIEINSTDKTLKYLDMISVIAAANRITQVAEDIAKLIMSISPTVERQQVGLLILVIFQAAAVFEDHEKWFKWLKETLANVATQLPYSSEQNRVLNTYLQHLQQMDYVLPTSSWFHARAKSIASAGARI